jgi:ABC-type transport system involved in cytochrome c biogenesis permease component
MAVLPIVARELRVASRRKSTYRFRLSVAVGALIIGGWIMLIPDLRSPQHLGMAMFIAISVVAFIESFLAGVITSSDSISEEKREGTLGLLFLTDLKGYDIVFGKLVATSLNAFYGMLAVFPIMAIPLLAGGVTGGEFGRVILAAINNLFFSLAVGVFASALSRDERAAGLATFLALVIFAAVLPLIGGMVTKWDEKDPLMLFFLVPSPAYSAFAAFDQVYQSAKASGTNYFYISLACVHVCAWLFLLLACVIVPRSWQDKSEGGARRGLLNRLRYGTASIRLAWRRHALGINPFYWLVSRDRMGIWLVWGLLAFTGLIWLWGLARFKRDFLSEPIYFLTGFMLHVLLKLWIAGEAAKRLGQDRRSGALELILSTPLSVRKILSGQLLGLWKQFSGPTMVVLAIDLIFLWAERQNEEWVLMCVVGMIILIADLIALAWVGMWMGLRSRHANRAAAAAVARVMVLPWVLWGGIMTLLAISSMRFGARWMNEEFVMVFWAVVSLAVAAGFALWSRARLLNDFRVVATQRHDQKLRLVLAETSPALQPQR